MIAGHIHSDPEDTKHFNSLVLKKGDYNECVYTLIAEAARIIDEIETGCDDHFMDVQKAIEHYADELKKYLMRGEYPWPLMLYKLAVSSIQKTLD